MGPPTWHRIFEKENFYENNLKNFLSNYRASFGTFWPTQKIAQNTSKYAYFQKLEENKTVENFSKNFLSSFRASFGHLSQNIFSQNMHIFKNRKKIRLCRKKSKSRVFGSLFALSCPRKIIFSKIQRCHALSWRNFELSGWTDGHTDRGNFIGPFPSFLGGPKTVG